MFLPSPIKKLVAVFRGEASPLMILLTVLFGFWFGLMPGWYGLHVVLLSLTLILNINVGIFLLSAALGKSVCYAAAPVLYHAGAWTQDALSEWLRVLAAIPIVGLTDFSRYSVAGATVIGPATGLILGLILARSIVAFRRTCLRLEDNSEAFRRWRNKRWIRFLNRLLLGKGVKDVRAVLTRRPKVVRKTGIALALLLIAASAFGIQWAEDHVAAEQIANAMTNLNRAEVDLEAVDLDVTNGQLSLAGLHVTDPDRPTHNSIEVGQLSARVSLWNLGLGRLVVDQLSLSAVKFDQPRQTAGATLPKTTVSRSPLSFDARQFNLNDTDPAELERYFKNAQALRDQLAKISKWLPERSEQKDLSAQERQVPERYLAYLTAKAPAAPTPRIVVRQIQLDDVVIPIDPFGNSTITCTNLSDAPAALGQPVTIGVASKDHPATHLEICCHYDQPEAGATVKAGFGGVDLAQFQSKLNDNNPVKFKAGVASGLVEGKATRHTIDLALKVKTENLAIDSTGGGVLDLDPRITNEAFKVLSNVETTLRVVGPIARPRLAFDVPALRQEFADALLESGKNELARQIDVLASEHLGKTGIGENLSGENVLETGKNLAETLLGGKREKKKDGAP